MSEICGIHTDMGYPLFTRSTVITHKMGYQTQFYEEDDAHNESMSLSVWKYVQSPPY